MKKHYLRTLLCGGLAALWGGSAAQAQSNIQNLLPLNKGYVVASCFSSTTPYDFIQDPNGYVVLVFDATPSELTAAGTSLGGASYAWRRFHNDFSAQNGTPSLAREWTAGNLGEVFGITLDDASDPNIYVAATTAYGVHPYPAGNGPGTVYQLDANTGNITPFNCIPNGGASLGNHTFWRSSNGGHLYVTSMDDGLIYQLDTAGNCVGTFDHGVNGRPNEGLPVLADDPTLNYSQRGRLLWGIEAHQGRLYYGVWNTGRPDVWSVALDPASGAPQAATAQLEIPGTSFPTNYPVSDIAFSETGQLYTAHRYHRGVGFGGPHQPPVLEFNLVAGSWDNPSPTNTFRVGTIGANTNSAGGVGVECTGAVWASGDAINLAGLPAVYGAMRIPPGGNATDAPVHANSHIIDFDDYTASVLKNYMGDIESYDPCARCFDISELEIECPKAPGEPFQATFKITNRSDQTAHYIWHNPCADADLPAGALTGQPLPTQPQQLPTPLATGDCDTITVSLPAPLSGGTFCWNITLLNETGGECCTDKACIDLPDCECFVVLDKSIKCTVDATGVFKYTLDIKIRNTSTFAWHYVNLLPPTTFTDASFDLSGSPVAPGDVYDIHTCVNGQAGDTICFNIAVHSENIEVCCAKECCLILPTCEEQKPDQCEVTRLAPCCPLFPGGPPFASAVLTICNNSPVARTYNWNMNAMPAGPGCNAVLALGAGAFVPSSGSTTIGPNSCANIAIAIDCEGVQPGRRACYQACVHQADDPTNRFCCDGRVFVPQQPDPVIKDDPVGGGNPGGAVILTPGAVSGRTLAVINSSDRAQRFSFEVRSLGDFVEIASPSATTPEFQSVKTMVVDLEPFETEIVSLDLRATGAVPFDNTLVPIMIYPLGPNGEATRTTTSFLAIAAPKRGGDPVLKGIAKNPDGTFVMTLATTPGRTYRIESSRTLGSIDPWAPVTCSTVENGSPGTEFLASGDLLLLQITPDPACPDNFFRAVELP